LVFAVILIFEKLATSTTVGFATGSGPLTYALTQCRVVLLYLRLFLAPTGQNADWRIPLDHGIFYGFAWANLMAMAGLIGAVCWLYKRARAVSFGLLIFLLTLVPTSSFVPIKDAMAERRMYLAVVGLAFALVACAERLHVKSRIALPVAAIALLGLSVLSYRRSEVWATDVSLWRDTATKNPRNARAHAGLGGSLMLRHDCAAAAPEFKIVVGLQGLDKDSGMNLGSAYECSGQADLALATFREVVAKAPVADAFTRIGYLEGRKENIAAAFAAFDEALRLDPNSISARNFRGVARAVTDDAAGAKDDFRHVLLLDPGNAIATSWIVKLR